MNQDHGSLALCLKALHLSSFAAHLQEMTATAESQGWSYQQYLQHLAELELEDRNQRRIERLLKTSGLPGDKTLASLDVATLPDRVKKVLPSLCEGHFLKRSENILAFGLPGRGKTHMLCAIGHELVRRGHTVLLVPAYRLVQSLLVAKRDLNLEKELKKLDRFEAVIIDDIGYVQQDREEMEVLFTFLAERYERGSVLISSNLVFSQWDKIFKDSMTTAAAIDRLVHHCVILELTGQSYRNQEAQKRNMLSQPRGQDNARSTDLTPEDCLAGAEVGAQE